MTTDRKGDDEDARRRPEPSHGADEEGEAPVDEGGDLDSKAAWISRDRSSDRMPPRE